MHKILLLTVFILAIVAAPLGADETQNDPTGAGGPAVASSMPASAKDVSDSRSVVYKKVGDVELKLHIFMPPNHQPGQKRPAVVFFFGGGWLSGSPSQFVPQCKYFAARGMVAAAAEYRVFNTHKAMIADCVADAQSAVRWMRARAEELGIDPDRIVAAGGSAGGHLAAATGTLKDFTDAKDSSISFRPNALILFNPVVDLTRDEPVASARAQQSGGIAARMGAKPIELSPVDHVKTGVPPTIIFHGREDPIVPFTTVEAFGKAMKAAGNRCEVVGFDGQKHGFFNPRSNDKAFIETLRLADRFLVSLGYLRGEPVSEKEMLKAVSTQASGVSEASRERLNVLMIAVDDLRPETGCYGATHMHTPHIDRLAKAGMVMERAYCQQAVCSPSRTSLMTGRRPDTTKIYDLNTHFRKTIPDVITLPEHFRKNGYQARAMGKIYHGGLDDPRSWDVPQWLPEVPEYGKPETLEFLKQKRERLMQAGYEAVTVVEQDATGMPLQVSRMTPIRAGSWEDPDVPDNALADGQVADKAVETLNEIKDKPFFLAVGFLKPHLPFVAPKKYYDLYPLEQITLADNPAPPQDVPPIALSSWGELRAYSDIPKKGPLSDEKARELIRGYRAATSYMDAQIGRVLDELDRLGLREKTIVVLWGDHGWQLGEHGLWCKHTNFEVATRSPLIVSAPGRKAVNAHSNALVEFVDIYPTLCELCGLSLPEGLEGTSMVPLLDDPRRSWKPAAFSQYPRGNKTMGYSMRTDRYRYTEWIQSGEKSVGVELYDHQADPNENVNVAMKPEMQETIATLKKQLHAGWQAARP